MNVLPTPLPGVTIIEPRVFGDERGFFLESFHERRYRAETGIDARFVQDNHSRSGRGVLRGIHAQRRHPQGKLISVSRGAVFDVVVDIDPASARFGQWFGLELSDDNHRQLWIPPGYGHGFKVLSDVADFQYKCTEYYDPDDEIGVIWSDSDVGIEWPGTDPIVSAKDQRLPTLAQLVLSA